MMTTSPSYMPRLERRVLRPDLPHIERLPLSGAVRDEQRRKAVGWFREYGDSHAHKRTDEGDEKAMRNWERARFCEGVARDYDALREQGGG